jgi:hypothetical protein
MKLWVGKEKRGKQKRKSMETIKSMKGKEEKYAQEVEKRLKTRKLRKNRNIMDVQANITSLKQVLVQAARTVCGTKKKALEKWWSKGGPDHRGARRQFG